MKIGDLVKVKDSAGLGNTYMQQIAGWIAVVSEDYNSGWLTIVTQGKTWRVCPSDVEVICK